MSLGVCLAGAGAVLGTAWAVQAGTLPPPPPASRVAANAAVALYRHTFAVDVFDVRGRRRVARCLEGSFRLQRRRPAIRGSLISFSPGPLVFVSNRVTAVLRGPALPALPAALAASMGCPHVLGRTITRGAETNRFSMERGHAAGEPAIALEFPGRRRLTLYVAPGHSNLPLVAVIAGRGQSARARLYLGPITAGDLKTFGAYLTRGERRKYA